MEISRTDEIFVLVATSGGWLTFDELPGKIKTGCQLTPVWQSKYCYDHAPHVHNKVMKVSEPYCPEEVVQIITGKKQTRNGTYYQVQLLLWCVCVCVCVYVCVRVCVCGCVHYHYSTSLPKKDSRLILIATQMLQHLGESLMMHALP